ncbi:uncharacterized protein VTP21DRAFT_4969 [Calcarisporiella thermophila]|uniref:uncharacterized protein n=1 Tax=Calcarisporiella thermophila TaxID=911321 RepID=UPI0037428E40
MHSIWPRLPPTKKWSSLFKVHYTLQRVLLNDPGVAQQALDALGLRESKGMHVLEINPGPGVMTGALASVPGIQRVYPFESEEPFYPYLQPPEGQLQDRIRPLCIPKSEWFTDEDIITECLEKDVPKMPWSEVHPSLFLLASLPKGSRAPAYFSKVLQSINFKSNVYQFGRVPLGLWVPTPLSKKIMAKPGKQGYCKLGIMCHVATECEAVLSPPATSFTPKCEYELLRITPRSHLPIQASLDVFSFIMAKLFSIPTSQLHKSIKLLGPGAEILLRDLPFSPEVRIRSMTVEQFDAIATAFEKWPFRPQSLFDYTLAEKEDG